MTTKAKYSEWKKKWRDRSFEDGYIETKAFLSEPTHHRVTELAKELGERIPIVLGEIVESYFSAIDQKSTSINPLKPKHKPISPTSANMLTLTEMIIKSRFPGDSGASRYRQVAFVNMIEAEIRKGNKPIAKTLAESVASFPSQMEDLAKLLEIRGVISRTRFSRIGKVLAVRDDAVTALDHAHATIVGASLLE